MALDWDFTKEKIYGFESFRDGEVYIDVVAALPDNSKVLFYSNSKKKIFNLTRQKPAGVFDRVFESWQELKLRSPSPYNKNEALARIMENQDDFDFVDQLAYSVFGFFNSWYNPFDRIDQRRRFFEKMSNGVKDFFVGPEGELAKIERLEQYEQLNPYVIPQKMEQE